MAYQTLVLERDRMPFIHTQAGQPPPPPPPPPTTFTPVINQFPSKFVGYYLKPTILSDGQRSWDQITTQKMSDSEDELAEIVKKDPSQNKPDEALRNKHLNNTKRQHIHGILKYHIDSERAFDMTWKLVSIKLVQEKVFTSTAIKVVNKSIRVILKRISRPVPGTVRHQSMSFPTATGPAIVGLSHEQRGTPMATFESPRIPFHTTPTIHQNTGHHGAHGVNGLFGEQTHSAPAHHTPEPRLREGMTRLSQGVEVIDDHTYEEHEDAKNHKVHKKNDKKQKDKQKAKPIEIYIPNHERHNSKNSSRSTSWYESDGLSVLDSPMTSVSGSSGGWQESKYRTKYYKKYRSGRGGDNPRHNRRTSFGAHSNDSFVVIPHHSQRSGHKNKHSTSSLDVVGLDSPKYRRGSQHHEDRVFAGAVEKLGLEKLSLEIDKKIQDQRRLEQDQVINRLDRRLGDIETILHNGSSNRSREIYPRERPPWDRDYNEIYEVGYSSPRRRNRSDRAYR